jgi:hypothetical protein
MRDEAMVVFWRFKLGPFAALLLAAAALRERRNRRPW